MTLSICPTCGSKKVRRVTGVLTVMVGAHAMKVPGIEYFKCSKCGEILTDADNEKKIDEYVGGRAKRKRRVA